MWRLQLNCRHLQPCADCGSLQQLQEYPFKAYRRKVQAHRRKRLQGQNLMAAHDLTSSLLFYIYLQRLQKTGEIRANNSLLQSKTTMFQIQTQIGRQHHQILMIFKSFFRFSGVKSFGVIGAGQMGTGIAIVANRVAKLPVLIYDSNPVSLKKSQSFVNEWLAKETGKKRITEQQIKQFNQRISYTEQISSFQTKDVDFVVEAIVENINVKQSVLGALDRILKPEAIIASNTSSISITKLASFTKRPDKVIGMHFMNPVPVMKLVEVIRALQTSDSTHQITQKLALQMGKEISTSKDTPGFIANRLLMPYINEAVFALYESVGTKEDIDKTMKLGTNVPMGPLALADFIGLDTCLFIMEVIHKDLGDSKYRPCPMLVNYVNAGYLGVKSGRGFYEYKKK